MVNIIVKMDLLKQSGMIMVELRQNIFILTGLFIEQVGQQSLNGIKMVTRNVRDITLMVMKYTKVFLMVSLLQISVTLMHQYM